VIDRVITVYVMLTIICGWPIWAAPQLERLVDVCKCGPYIGAVEYGWVEEESAERRGSRLSMCNLCVRSAKDNDDDDD